MSDIAVSVDLGIKGKQIKVNKVYERRRGTKLYKDGKTHLRKLMHSQDSACT